MNGAEFDRIDRQVKLVIWDLDDTFWRGTLSEGPISPVQSNIDLVRTLAERGIISSICSKNDFDAAREALAACGAWEHFVFPKIDFTPKGARVAALIEEMNLRAENVLFIDDNVMNLREVLFAAPGVMSVHPDAVLTTLLDNRFLAGKPDPDLNRLRHYRQLEQKAIDQSASPLSNEDFLRQCGIKVRFIYDLEPMIDRLIDLINRSNQLNYTKLRIADDQREAFVERLKARDVYAGAVSVADRYGDYGIVGFFLQTKDPMSARLEHLVFSCRTMHMGIEQYVYEHLGKPPLDIVGPVANDLVSYETVDWISENDGSGPVEGPQTNGKLVLVGGCDLMQVASYLTQNRVEFVNDVRGGIVIRYDDFGFVLNDRPRLEASSVLPQIPCWTAREALAFDRELEDADMVIISLWVALRGRYLMTDDGLVVRVHPYGLGEYFDRGGGSSLLGEIAFHKPGASDYAALLKASILRIAALSPRGHRILLGANTRIVDPQTPKEDRDQRILYNTVCKELASAHDGLDYVDIDTLIDPSLMVDEWHYTRLGYLRVAERIKGLLAEKPAARPLPPADLPSISEVIEGSPSVRKSGPFGPQAYEAPTLKKRLIGALKKSRAGRAALHLAKSALAKDGARPSEAR